MSKTASPHLHRMRTESCAKHLYIPPTVARPRGAPCRGTQYRDFLGRWQCNEPEWVEPCRWPGRLLLWEVAAGRQWRRLDDVFTPLVSNANPQPHPPRNAPQRRLRHRGRQPHLRPVLPGLDDGLRPLLRGAARRLRRAAAGPLQGRGAQRLQRRGEVRAAGRCGTTRCCFKHDKERDASGETGTTSTDAIINPAKRPPQRTGPRRTRRSRSMLDTACVAEGFRSAAACPLTLRAHGGCGGSRLMLASGLRAQVREVWAGGLAGGLGEPLD
jgi:hypothetical protein